MSNKVAGPSFTPQQQGQILAKTGGKCTYCGMGLVQANYGKCTATPPQGAWEVEHWLPESEGGPNTFPNQWPACCDCNDKKHTDDGELYILRRVWEGKRINGEIAKRVIDAGPGRLRDRPQMTRSYINAAGDLDPRADLDAAERAFHGDPQPWPVEEFGLNLAEYLAHVRRDEWLADFYAEP